MDDTSQPVGKHRPGPCGRHLAPDRFLTALLPIAGLLWLSERHRRLAFNEHKSRTVPIAVAVVCGAAA